MVSLTDYHFYQYQPQMQETNAIFPNGLWEIDHRRPNRHWGIVQCNSLNGAPDNPFIFPTISYPRRSASEFLNIGH